MQGGREWREGGVEGGKDEKKPATAQSAIDVERGKEREKKRDTDKKEGCRTKNIPGIGPEM